MACRTQVDACRLRSTAEEVISVGFGGMAWTELRDHGRSNVTLQPCRMSGLAQFDMLMISSQRQFETAFRLPLLVLRSSIRPPKREICLRGPPYNAGRRRSECIYSRTLIEAVSELLSTRCYAEFYSEAALHDRRARAIAEDALDRRLFDLEDSLEVQLAEALTEAEVTS